MAGERRAWVERGPNGEFRGITTIKPGTNGTLKPRAGSTVEEMSWEDAFKAAHEKCCGGDPS